MGRSARSPLCPTLTKLVTATNAGDFTWRVAWGERALKIAREAGVWLPEEQEATATA